MPPTNEMIDDHSPPRTRQTAIRKRLIIALMEIRWIATLMGFTILLICYPTAQQLQLDRSITAMFDPTDSTRVEYEQLQEAFGGNAIAILVYTDQSTKEVVSLDDQGNEVVKYIEQNAFSIEGMARSREISQRVVEIPGVKGVLSPAKLSAAVEKIRPAGFLSGFSRKTPGLMRRKDLVARLLDRDFSGYTHSADHSRGAVAVMLNPDHDETTIRQLKELAEQLPLDYPDAIGRTALVGEPVLVHDAFDLIERDGAKLATYTILLLSFVMLLALLDLRLVLLTALIIIWSVTVTKAIMVWTGISLSLVSTILTSIVTVIAVATVLHIGVRFRTARSRGHTRYDSATMAFRLLAAPIVWTCATDAAGFAALTWSRILPVRDFGLMIAMAATGVLIGTLLFAPAALTLPGIRFGSSLQRGQRLFARRLQKACLRLAACMVHQRIVAVTISLVIAVLAVFGVSRTEVETSFLNNFRRDSPIVIDYDEVEDNFGGAGVWDIVVAAPTMLTDDYLDQVRDLETKLREIDVEGASLTKVLSMADADAAATRSPLMKLAKPEIRIAGMRTVMPVFVDALLTPYALPETPDPGTDASFTVGENSERKFRIMLRSREHLDADKKTRLIAAVEKTVADHTDQLEWQEVAGRDSSMVTGYYVMMARLVSQLVADQWRCFVASGILVWLLLLLATQSLRLATAALLPNLLPVFLILALVGFFGGKINMGATMIAAVSVGLSIDGSVHFLAGYRRRRRRGHAAIRAATHAAGDIGVPVLFATIALVIGFSVLVTSEFIPTATFGTLVAATLAAGTAINLTLLPAFVAWVDP